MLTLPYDVVLHRTKDHQYFGIYVCEDVPMGVYIATIEPGSPASKTHIQPGDRVIAINGQSVLSMDKNPQEHIIQIANRSDMITLSIQPSDILKFLDLSSNINTNFGIISLENNGINQDLEQFLQSVFNENIQIAPSLSNLNDYILTSSDRSSKLNHRRRRRRRRCRSEKQIYRTTETQTALTDEEQENTTPKSLSERRSVPSMGTSQVLLRNNTNISQKDIPTINNTVFALPAPAPPSPVLVERAPSPLIRRLSSDHFEVKAEPVRKNNPPRQITVRRSPNFEGYGFHIQYNRHFYLIQRVEPHSPAEKAGLVENDVICSVNNQSTDKMPHKTFVQIMNNSSEVKFLVQDEESFMTKHPELTEKLKMRPPSPPERPPTNTKSPSGLNRVFQKMTSR